MKTIILLLTLCLGFTANANTIDLRNGFNGKSGGYYLQNLRSGERVVVNFNRGTYVESIKIAAIGTQRRYSFGKVYADGEEIATLGIPGRDPEYPITIRGRVNTIEVVATQGSRFRITDFKIFTNEKRYTTYQSRRSYARNNYHIDHWGLEVLDIINELDFLFGTNQGSSRRIFLDLKRAAMRTEASDKVRDPKSLKTFRKAMNLVKKLIIVEDYLLANDFFLLDSTADMLITDLMTVKEDISEKYDLDFE